MEFIKEAIDMVLHMDQHLGPLIQRMGIWIYVLLFAIVFCETGLVVTPFLPGDSLLFTLGAFCAIGSLNLWVILISLLVAAILGDTVNYWIGHFFGEKMFNKERRFLKRSHLEKTHAFYEKYGGKTIIIARFVPIVRTFAPFVAGMGSMTYSRFMMYNVVGAFLWIVSLTILGYMFGQHPFVKKNFGLVIIAIIILSILPAVIEIARECLKARRNRAA